MAHDPIDRRTFLKAAGASAGAVGLGLAGAGTAAPAPAPAPGKWRKAFMLGAVTSGAVLPHFELLKEAGFEGVELISPNGFDRNEVIQARDKTGLVIHGVSGSQHWKDTLSDPNPEVVERGLAAVRKEMDDCKVYGGTTVLLVPAVVTPKVSYRDAYARSQGAIKTLVPDAEKHGVKIAVEEVWNKFLLSPIEFGRYIDEIGSPAVGAYFDVGNVVEYGYPQEWIRELGKRILKIHIKEYKKAKRFDYELGQGEIDWKAVKQALTDVGYDGWITAEVGFGDLKTMTAVVGKMDDLLGTG